MRTVSQLRLSLPLLATILTGVSSTQSGSADLLSPHTQADYVIITKEAFVPTMQPLASFRSAINGFSVLTITTEEIYSTFGQGIPADSAIREFISFSLRYWEDPKPQFFLLAGNVNVVPSHKEPGFEFIDEDSIMVDQWFVEGLPDTSGHLRPAAAIGRFPGWDSTQLTTMVAKTIVYESMSNSTWFARSIFVADYETAVGNIYEVQSDSLQSILSTVWDDTVTVHVRESSPLHLTREEFRGLVNQGAGLVSSMGYHEWYFFSNALYFTTWDVDSLANSSRTPFWFFSSSQRFEREDTLAIAVNLMQVAGMGAVGAIGPTGHTFATEHFTFLARLFTEMVGSPGTPIGTMFLAVKQSSSSRGYRITALLADPALVIRTMSITGNDQDPPSIPAGIRLDQNYPNPFNPLTTISFSLSSSAEVTLRIYSLLGEEVATLASGEMNAGTYSIQWDATGQPSGMYFYRLQAGGFTETRKLVLLR